MNVLATHMNHINSPCSEKYFFPTIIFWLPSFFFPIVNSFRLLLLSPIKKITDRNVK